MIAADAAARVPHAGRPVASLEPSVQLGSEARPVIIGDATIAESRHHARALGRGPPRTSSLDRRTAGSLMRRISLIVVLSAWSASGCHRASAPLEVGRTDEVDSLLGLIRDRLIVMHDVARWKWVNKSSIEDREREAALLKDVVDRGTALGLDPDVTRSFFAAQIEAAKLVQGADFRRWETNTHARPGAAPDLARVLRPRIDVLNRKLLTALARSVPALHTDRRAVARLAGRADAILVDHGIDRSIRATAIRSLIIAEK